MMFCLFISEKHCSVLLKALAKDLKSGAHSLEIKKLKSEYSDFKQLTISISLCNTVSLGFFFNFKPKISKGT